MSAFGSVLGEMQGDGDELFRTHVTQLTTALERWMIRMKLDRAKVPPVMKVHLPRPYQVTEERVQAVTVREWAQRLGLKMVNGKPERVESIECTTDPVSTTLTVRIQ